MEEGALLVGRIERWAWALTVALSLAGFLAGGLAVAGGVAAGGAVGILNFRWLHFFLRIVLIADTRWAKLLAHLGTGARYLALTAVIVLLIKTRWFNLLAVLAGLSVVSVAVVGAGLTSSLQSSRTADQPG